MVVALAGVVLATWLVEELILVSVVVKLHLLLHFLLNVSLEPVLCTFQLICLIDHVLVLIFDMLYHKIITFEDLFAYFTAEDFTIIVGDLFTFVSAEVFDILVDELFGWVKRHFWTVFNSLDSLVNISLEESDTAAPF